MIVLRVVEVAAGVGGFVVIAVLAGPAARRRLYASRQRHVHRDLDALYARYRAPRKGE